MSKSHKTLLKYIEDLEERLKTMTVEEKEKLFIECVAKQEVMLDMLSTGHTRDFENYAKYGQGVIPDEEVSTT